MTPDERHALSMLIALHGFVLYKRRSRRDHRWRPLLVGRPAGVDGTQAYFEHIPQWVKDDSIATFRYTTHYSKNWVAMEWSELSDKQLQDFFNTVVSTG